MMGTEHIAYRKEGSEDGQRAYLVDTVQGKQRQYITVKNALHIH
jgi:hypothetical protein